MAGRVLMASMFFPRGGSAHVARNLAAALPAHGWDVTIVTTSVAGQGDARRFYAGCDLVAVDATAALAAPDPLRADPPLHPSYEDRPDAPDRFFAGVDDATYEHLVAHWSRALQQAGAPSADVLHLHHLTPLNAAAARVAPGVPVVAHLHGTELLMLEAIEAEPRRWPHAAAWGERLRAWAQAADHLLVLSQSAIGRAERLLGVEPGRMTVVHNGFDPDRFHPRALDRRAHWHEHLPHGDPLELAAFDRDAPVLLYVGRFTAVKRVPLLVEAHQLARRLTGVRAPLVLLGGFPGEHECEHPRDTIARLGAEDVFLAGWHEHDALPDFLAASDVLVLPSVREQFGQVLVEAMACGLPVVAVDRHGPREIVRDGETGWLVEPDDVDGLARALAEAVQGPSDLARRGRAALTDARARFSWPALAGRVAAAYAGARTETRVPT